MRATAAEALAELTEARPEQQAALAKGGAIKDLVELVRVGAGDEDRTRMWAAQALRRITAADDISRMEVAVEKGLQPLVRAHARTSHPARSPMWSTHDATSDDDNTDCE